MFFITLYCLWCVCVQLENSETSLGNLRPNMLEENTLYLERKVVWCVKKWVRIRYEGGIILVGGSADNSTIAPVHSFLFDCNKNEPQGWYYLASLDARLYGSFSISIAISSGRVCNSLAGCLCTYTSTDTTIPTDFLCSMCNFSLCGEVAQAPVLTISMMAVPRYQQSISYAPTTTPSYLHEERSQRNITRCVDFTRHARNETAAASSSGLEIELSLRYVPTIQEVQFSISRVVGSIHPTAMPSPSSKDSQRSALPISIPSSATYIMNGRLPSTRELSRDDLPPNIPSPRPFGHHFSSSNIPTRTPVYPTLSHPLLPPLFPCPSWANQTVWQQLYSLPVANTTRTYLSGRIATVLRVDSLCRIGKQGAATYKCLSSLSRPDRRCMLSFEVGSPASAVCSLGDATDMLAVSLEVQATIFSDLITNKKGKSLPALRGELSVGVLGGALLVMLAIFLLLCHLLSVRTRCQCCDRATAGYSPIAA